MRVIHKFIVALDKVESWDWFLVEDVSEGRVSFKKDTAEVLNEEEVEEDSTDEYQIVANNVQVDLAVGWNGALFLKTTLFNDH